MVAVFGGVFVQHVKSALYVGGVHDELCEVSSSHLRGVANLEAWRRAANERGYALYTLVFLQNVSQTVRHGAGTLKSFALGEEYLHGKLVAVGIGELSHLQGGEDEACGRHNH